jgi:hypothetical protein
MDETQVRELKYSGSKIAFSDESKNMDETQGREVLR